MEGVVELGWIVSVLRRWWLLIVVCAVVAGGAAFAASSWMQPVYSAEVTLLVDKASTGNSSEYNTILASERLANTYSHMLTGRMVMEKVIARLGLTQSPSNLAGKTTVRSVPDTQLIQVSVESTSPQSAALLADTIAGVFIEQVHAQETERYTMSLANMQAEMDELASSIGDTETTIDSLNAAQIEAETDLGRMQTVLADRRDDYRARQQAYEELRLAAARSANTVRIVESAQPPETRAGSPYTATVTLLLEGPAGSVTVDSVDRLARTYGAILTARPMLEAVLEQLGLDESPASLAQRIEARPVADTQLIELHVVDVDATQAVRVANTLADLFVADMRTAQQEPYGELLADMQAEMQQLSVLINDTEAAIDSLGAAKIAVESDLADQQRLLAEYRSESRALQQDYDDLQVVADLSPLVVSISETATVPQSPIRPRPLLTTALAALVGMVVGAGVAFLLEYVDDRIRTPEDVARTLGLGVLGAIGRVQNGGPRLVVSAKPGSHVTESFRVLLTNIRYSSLDQPLRTLLVTSPDASAGKSFVVANLVTVAARAGLRAVAVDADLRQPQLHRYFDLNAKEGLVDSLLEGRVDGRLLPTEEKGLQILGSGAALPANPGELVGSQRMHALLEQLAHDVDLVVIDSPPVLPVADTLSLAPMVDGVLLVLDAGHTRRQAVVRATDSLRQVGVRVIGVVLNRMPAAHGSYYTLEQKEKQAKAPGRAHTWLKAAYRKRAQ